LVMKSLKHLVEKDGVTVVSVIHQPRKFIYDLFDSLILLGVGGRMVYHGPTENAESYFGRLNYTLPQGESVADWLIDISSGRLDTDNHVAETKMGESLSNRYHSKEQQRQFKEDIVLPALQTVVSEDENECDRESCERAGDDDSGQTSPSKESSEGSNPGGIRRVEMMNRAESESTGFDSKDTESEHSDFPDPPVSRRSTTRLRAASRVVTDGNCVGKKGVTTGKVVQALEEAKERRAWLCEEWSRYFDRLRPDERSIYEPPQEYDLPFHVEEPPFWTQFRYQLRRASVVAWRNRFSKTIDCSIIVVAVIAITALDGVTEVSLDQNPDIPYEVMLRPLEEDLSTIFQQLFSYSLTHQIQYPLKVGIILSVLLGLTATKIVTSKRLEFFREAGSGYNLNAYFCAISILSTIEHSIQVVISAFFASWIRNPVASNVSYYIHFLLLAWITVGWALLIPMVFPSDTVTLVAGFFFAFCGLMFSGAFAPIQYHQIYEGGFKEVFAGWISPTRFFYEALAVGEYRCLPEQSGYTIEPSSINRLTNSSMTIVLGYAGHDYSAVRWSCSGWYWSVIPVILIGCTIRYLAIGAMHSLYRGQQAKKSLLYVMRRNARVAAVTLIYCLGFVALFFVTTWLFVRDQPFEEPEPPSKAEILDRYGFFS